MFLKYFFVNDEFIKINVKKIKKIKINFCTKEEEEEDKSEEV